jgi:hypothetical protein
MRKSPATALQAAIYQALTAAGLTKVYHTVPANAVLPWVVIGQDHILADYDSADISECHSTVHVFAESMPAVKAISETVCDALDKAIQLDGFQTDEAYSVSQQYLVENGGRNGHAVLEFMYRVQAI